MASLWFLLICVLGTLRYSHAQPCQIDESLCTKTTPPKLDVKYSGMEVKCNEVRHINDVSSKPRIYFKEGDDGSQYVLVMVDPDAPRPCANTDGSNYLHYAAVVTQQGNELVADQELVHYSGPQPPVATHRYQFYVFPWSSNQPPSLRNTDWSRGGFKLQEFKDDNHLTDPSAVFQFKVPSQY